MDFTVGNLIDYFHPFYDLAKYAVSVLFGLGAGKIERRIVAQVDEKLTRCAIDAVQLARHGDGSSAILQSVMGFIPQRRLGGTLREVGIVSAAKHNEIVIDLMENSAVVLARLHVA